MTDFLTKRGWKFPDDPSAYITRTQNNVAGLPIYIGKALPGTVESDAGWQINKITYDAPGNLIGNSFADGTNSYNKIWDDRADYTYLELDTIIQPYDGGSQEAAAWSNIGNIFDAGPSTFGGRAAVETDGPVTAEADNDHLICEDVLSDPTDFGTIGAVYFGVRQAGVGALIYIAVRPMPGGVDSYYGDFDHLYQLPNAGAGVETVWTGAIPPEEAGIGSWTWPALYAMHFKVIPYVNVKSPPVYIVGQVYIKVIIV